MKYSKSEKRNHLCTVCFERYTDGSLFDDHGAICVPCHMELTNRPVTTYKVFTNKSTWTCKNKCNQVVQCKTKCMWNDHSNSLIGRNIHSCYYHKELIKWPQELIENGKKTNTDS